MGKKILDIDVLDVEKRRVPSKHYVYVILVKWSDSTTLTVFRRYSRFFDLQAKLLELFPIEGGSIAPEKRIIPFLPGKIFFGRSHIKDVAVKRLDDIRVYCKSLIKLPAHISESEEVIDFFEVEPEDLDPPTSTQDDGKSKSSKEKKAEKISKPKRLDRYVAVAEYEVQASGEMVLYPGLRVEVLEKSDSGWWFVNSEDEQGWVPSTYLEPESGDAASATPAAVAEPGMEENFICIEKFEGASEDEVSLEKGAVVQVLQKNLDGWWLVRYMGREAYAPGTYLKKATSGQTLTLVEKSRLSGVQIISSLQDVSTLLNQDQKDASPTTTKKYTQDIANASALVKTRSLERGGSLIPPPRQNSVVRVDAPVSMRKSSVYVTIEDFEDTVGDGLSFKSGQQVHVKEKTATGWWFVDIEGQEGWVPSSYLESFSESQNMNFEAHVESTSQDEFSDEDWYDQPDLTEDTTSQPNYMDMAKRPLPPIPPDEEEPAKEQRASESPRMAHRPLPAAPAAKESTKAAPVFSISKKTSLARDSDTTRVGLKPKDSAQCKPALPAGGGGEQDLAAILKAKFAARSGANADNGNSSEEDASSKQSKQPQAESKAQPLVPKKPSEIKRDHSNSAANVTKSPPRPSPPVKNKPLKPPVLSKPNGNSGAPIPAAKAGFPGVQLRPVSKSGVADNTLVKNDKNGGLSTSVQGNVKSITASFSDSASQKPKPAVSNKPLVAGKPKPATLAKPAVASKPSLANPKPSQTVNNLANNLSGKLNFGKKPQDIQVREAAETSSQAPPQAPTGTSYVALYDFTAENDGEISFREGDDLEVLDEQGDWTLVRCWDEEGWAPTNYLQKV